MNDIEKALDKLALCNQIKMEMQVFQQYANTGFTQEELYQLFYENKNEDIDFNIMVIRPTFAILIKKTKEEIDRILNENVEARKQELTDLLIKKDK